MRHDFEIHLTESTYVQAEEKEFCVLVQQTERCEDIPASWYRKMSAFEGNLEWRSMRGVVSDDVNIQPVDHPHIGGLFVAVMESAQSVVVARWMVIAVCRGKLSFGL